MTVMLRENTEKVFIIVLNWNGWSDTLRCLESLRSITARGFHYRIVVVDNHSTDNSPQHLLRYRDSSKSAANFHFIACGENLGFGGGNNRGISYAMDNGADFVCLLNNDTEVAGDFLEDLLAAARAYPEAGMLNPKILMLDADSKSDSARYAASASSRVQEKSRARTEYRQRLWWIGGSVNALRTAGRHRYFAEEDRGQFDGGALIATDYATGCCVLVKRAVIEKIGLLPEEYFLYYEDTEWSLRARKAGFACVVVPAARVWHRGSASTKPGSPAYIRYHVRNGLLLALRIGNPLQISCAYGWSLVRACWHMTKMVLRPPQRLWSKAILQGIYDAWLGRSGKIPS